MSKRDKANLITTTVSKGGYKIISTSHQYKDGSFEGGYSYAVFKGEHLIDTGSTSWGKIIEQGINNKELLDQMESVVNKRDEDET